MRQHLPKLAGLSALLAILALTTPARPTTTLAAGPLLILSPGQGQPGSTITISGSGFHSAEKVSLYWNGGLVTTLPTMAGGGFSYLVYLSTTAPAGPRAVLATGSSGDQAGATFTVLPSGGASATATPTATPADVDLTATPTPAGATATPGPSAAHLSLEPSAAVPGSTITFNGSGFHAAETVSLYWNGGLVVALPASSSGTFSYQVLLSTTAPAGPRAVLATGSSGDQAGATFTVLAGPNPTASPTPTSGPPATASPTPRPQPTQPSGPTATPPTGPTATPPTGIPTSGSTSNGCQITSQQAAAEQSLFTLLNQHRAAAGAPALALNETLSLASRTHSCDMFQHQNLSHTGSDGSSPWQRIAAVGITFTTAGENIGMSGGLSLTAGVNTIDSEMMAEPLTPGDHHWNIVNPAYKMVGIGIIYTNNQVWLTEDFVG